MPRGWGSTQINLDYRDVPLGWVAFLARIPKWVCFCVGKTLNLGPIFAKKWPLKVGTGFAESAAHSRQIQI